MPNKTNESEWKKKFDDYFPQLIKEYPKTVETVKHFISNQLSLQATRIQQENREKINLAIANEMIICNQEGTPTSRLTSLQQKLLQ
ncbi:hypothetical protein M0R04_10080 [Candidatus Dojkabacteria bacterium]|jgi:hypothetical protein|nr:hypothetical protein [Candidatus Dojkabacteria bacterium]